MYRRISSIVALTLAMGPATALAAPGDAPATGERDPAGTSEDTRTPHYQRAPNPDDVQSSSQTTDQASSDGSQVKLVAADELIGRDVSTQEGERLGTLLFVTVSLDRGNVSHLIVDTEGTDFAPGAGAQQGQGDTGSTPQSATGQGSGTQGQQGGEQNANLLIVPWSVVRMDAAGSDLVVAATGQHLNNAPRLQREELMQLTEPTLASYVIDYWAPASELAALEGSRQQSQSETQQGARSSGLEKNQQSQSGSQGTPDDQSASGSPATAKKDAMTDSGTAGQQTADTSQPGASERSAGQSSPSQQGPATTEGGQVVLVGQEVVAAITPPMFQLSKQLRGAQVVDRSGNDVGEIRQIMIDTSTGDAAFAVIEGTSPGRAPVPLDALSWSAEGTTMLTAEMSKLRSNPSLTEQPSQATRDDLAQLYQRYGTQPYWEKQSGRSGQSTTQPAPSGTSTEVPQ